MTKLNNYEAFFRVIESIYYSAPALIDVGSAIDNLKNVFPNIANIYKNDNLFYAEIDDIIIKMEKMTKDDYSTICGFVYYNNNFPLTAAFNNGDIELSLPSHDITYSTINDKIFFSSNDIKHNSIITITLNNDWGTDILRNFAFMECTILKNNEHYTSLGLEK